MNRPLVSVVVCNYNHGKYLPALFRGFHAQTLTNFEIVLTDDGSTDGSTELLRQYASTEPRLRANFFPTNRGVKHALADAIDRAEGKYLFETGADDFVVNRDFFKKAVETLEADPRPAGFYGICGAYTDETEKLSGAMGTAEVEGFNTPLQCCQGFLRFRSIITSNSCIWRRDLFMKHGGNEIATLIEELGPQTDYYQNHDLAWRFGMHYEKTLFGCQRKFLANTNYSAANDIYAYAGRLQNMEKRLRTIHLDYAEKEKDWSFWRAAHLVDFIRKSGIAI